MAAFNLNLAPVGMTLLDFRRDLWHQKARHGVVCVILRLAVLLQYRRVSDD